MERKLNVNRTVTSPTTSRSLQQEVIVVETNDHDESKIHKRNFAARFRVQRLNHCSLTKTLSSVCCFVAPQTQQRVRVVRSAVVVVIIGLCFMAVAVSTSSSISSPSTLSSLRHTTNFVPDSASTIHIQNERMKLDVDGQQILKDAGYISKPLVMGYYFDGLSFDTYRGTQYLDPYMKRRLTNNVVEMTKTEMEEQKHLEDSLDYEYGKMDPFEEGDCVAQYDWQTSTYPTCNALHERDLTQVSMTLPEKYNQVHTKLLSNGYWRDVWLTRSFLADTTSSEAVILKTIRWEHDYEERNYDRHRRDAVSMERLTSQSRVIDIYGYCGNSGLFEFAPGGDIEMGLWGDAKQQWSETELLIVAYQVAAAIADMHNNEKEGVASMVHTDITPGQFVNVDGIYKLNDFNRVRFIRWNKRTNEPCGFYVGNNPGTFRSPEEYAYEEESEKIDVYSMGNIFYTLLTRKWPFEGLSEKKAKKNVERGERSPVLQNILSSNATETKVLLQAMKMCWKQDPKERATSRQVQNYLNEELEKLNIRNSKDGKPTGAKKSRA